MLAVGRIRGGEGLEGERVEVNQRGAGSDDGTQYVGWRGEVATAYDSGRDRDRDPTLAHELKAVGVEVPAQDCSYVAVGDHVQQTRAIEQPDVSEGGMAGRMDRRVVENHDRPTAGGGCELVGQPGELLPAQPAWGLAGHEAVEGDHPQPANLAHGCAAVGERRAPDIGAVRAQVTRPEHLAERIPVVMVADRVDVRDAALGGVGTDQVAHRLTGLGRSVVGDIAADHNEVEVGEVTQTVEQIAERGGGIDLTRRSSRDMGVGEVEDPHIGDPMAVPHLQIEYTADLVDLDPGRVLGAAMAALADQDLYDMPTAKGRIRRLDHFVTGRSDSGAGFVSVVLAILPGRTAEERHRTSTALTRAVADTIPQMPGTQVRTEVRVIDRPGYTAYDVPL